MNNISRPLVLGLSIITVLLLINAPTGAWSMAEQPAAQSVVTDPDDPQFDPKEFRLQNYSRSRGNNAQLPKALVKIFPPGTDKTYVEEILVKQGNARVGVNQITEYHNPGDSDYTYIWSPSGLSGKLVRFVFDENNKATMMTMGKTPIYGVDAINTLWQKEKERKQRLKEQKNAQ